MASVTPIDELPRLPGDPVQLGSTNRDAYFQQWAARPGRPARDTENDTDGPAFALLAALMLGAVLPHPESGIDRRVKQPTWR